MKYPENVAGAERHAGRDHGVSCGSVPSFAAGTALWSAALLLTSVPGEFATPLPFFAYPFLVLAFAGWIWTLLKSEPYRFPRISERDVSRSSAVD